jgi:hypothetical protein
MPTFNKSPFAAIPQKLIPGQVAYLYGSWPQDTSPTKGLVNQVALSTNVATVTVVINEGNVPAVGSLITIQKTATAAGTFNVTNIALASVTIAANGTGTLTFPLTHADVVAVADAGAFIIPQPETSETVANGQSVAVGLPYAEPSADTGQAAVSVGCEVTFPTVPTACVVALQGAMTNVDAAYQTVIANVVTVAGSSATYGTLQATGKWNFLRFSISGTSGSGTIVAKLTT